MVRLSQVFASCLVGLRRSLARCIALSVPSLPSVNRRHARHETPCPRCYLFPIKLAALLYAFVVLATSTYAHRSVRLVSHDIPVGALIADLYIVPALAPFRRWCHCCRVL